MTTARARCLEWALAINVFVALPVARAATLVLPNTPLAYTVVDQSLHDLLQEIGTQLGLHVSVSNGIQGTVHGRQPRLPAAAFLNRIGRIYGFGWYYDGATLYFYADSEVTSQFADLRNVSPAALNDALTDLGIADPRWPLRSSPAAGLSVIEGPPRYIELVQQTLTGLQQRQPAAVAGATDVRVFRGHAGGGA